MPSWRGRSGSTLGDRAPLAAVREAVLALRRGKGMVVDPADPDSASAGSFFTNPVLDGEAFAALARRAAERLGPSTAPPSWPDGDGRVKTSAAWLIERAGFHRGQGDPAGIAISSKHTLALTNRGAGTTAQLVALAREIAAGVRERVRRRAGARAGVRRPRLVSATPRRRRPSASTSPAPRTRHRSPARNRERRTRSATSKPGSHSTLRPPAASAAASAISSPLTPGKSSARSRAG